MPGACCSYEDLGPWLGLGHETLCRAGDWDNPEQWGNLPSCQPDRNVQQQPWGLFGLQRPAQVGQPTLLPLVSRDPG